MYFLLCPLIHYIGGNKLHASQLLNVETRNKDLLNGRYIRPRIMTDPLSFPIVLLDSNMYLFNTQYYIYYFLIFPYLIKVSRDSLVLLE